MDWPGAVDSAREVEIETTRGPDAPSHRTTIWAVVDGGEVYVRSLHGTSGRWFRELTAQPEAVLRVGDDSFSVRAVQAADPESVRRASNALRRKYAESRALDSMLAEDILDTTLRLEPR